MLFKGVYTAVITPFDPNDQLDEEGLRDNLRFQINNGVDGILLLGSTGESPTVDSSERKRIIEIGAEEIKGNSLFVVGTGSYSTKQTILNTCQAQELGADAALITTPFYNRPTQEGLFQHFASICHATSLPLCIYNHQGRTGINLQTATLKRLAAFPSIQGIKESSPNILQYNEIIEALSTSHPHFSILTGDDPLTLPTLSLGCHGVFSVVSNLVPHAVKNMVDAGLNGNFAEARKWHFHLMPLYHAAFIETNPIPIKAAMKMCGMAAGQCRLPLCDLVPESARLLKETIQNIPKEWYENYGQTQSEFSQTQCGLSFPCYS